MSEGLLVAVVFAVLVRGIMTWLLLDDLGRFYVELSSKRSRDISSIYIFSPRRLSLQAPQPLTYSHALKLDFPRVGMQVQYGWHVML